MKKVFCLFLCLALLFTFSGCRHKVKTVNYTAATYEALLISTSDGATDISEDALPWRSAEVEKPTTKTITYEGKEYTGTLYHSQHWLPDFRARLEYRGEEANFIVDGQTGDLIGFTDKKAGSFDNVVTAEQARQVADALAEKYVSLSAYTVKEGNTEGPLRTYRYYRAMGDETTRDFVCVVVDGQGQVYSFEKGDIGSFADVSSVTIDEAQVTAIIENKLNACYRGESVVAGQWESYETYDRELVRLPDGNIGLYCTIMVTFVPRYDEETGETYISGDCCEILIVTTPA